MSAGAPVSYIRDIVVLLMQAAAQLVRPPSHSRRADAGRRIARGWLALLAGGAAAIIILMFAFDVSAIEAMPPRGAASLWPLRIFTDFGKAAYVLSTLGGVLVIVVAVVPTLRGTPRTALLGFGARIEFLLLAVLLPMLLNEVLKGIIGRGRPFVGGSADAFHYSHFAWTQAYASFPSGHATVAFALAVAVPALWPRLRALMWAYAVGIAISRVVLLAHHPSDVVAGALTGIVGAMAVRYWFAARALVFTIDPEGRITSRPAAALEHLKRVARRPRAP